MEPNDLDPEVLELASKIFDLARTGDAATLAAYLDAGVPVNLTNDNGDTLLMLAAYYSHPEAVTVLLERKADPNFGNDKGQTPLSGAVFKGSDEIVQALLSAGADPNAGTPSARDAAEMFGQTKYLQLFTQ
ncbi:ankyrin repeat domain-containing protein [Nocardia yunnanensis]|uniref:Ankyrin repeat domain-containing protein n=1 Tax=Nocardia yunnanensis TaxID=2382165 RepID=A0A386ZJI3_9NOCA|nr:ankyrin repeat domain-containing protein [Nocardia yunnanensis]AYF77314.1 ankyrin repeat domain-containing protein [Nocardia yunnanensis]